MKVSKNPNCVLCGFIMNNAARLSESRESDLMLCLQ